MPNPSAAAAPAEATPNAPSVNTVVNHASNSIGNVDNLANNVSNLLNAFQ
jgi:hypothetical protein